MMTCCALLACVFSAHAYELVANVSMDEESKWHFDIELADNDIDFTAFQLDIAIDGDAKLERKDMTCGPLMHRHSLMVAMPQEHYRVAGYNLSGTTFKEKEGLLFSFVIDGAVRSININKIFFIKPDGTKVEAAGEADTSDRDFKDLKDSKDFKDPKDSKDHIYRIGRHGISIRMDSNP